MSIEHLILSIAALGFVLVGADSIGLSRWIDRRLNRPTSATPPAPVSVPVIELKTTVDNLKVIVATHQGDIDKLKLALGFKEFKSKG